MNNDDQEINELRKNWDEMTHEEKVDKFLWKMVWYHHTKHIPGSPATPIWDLAKVIGDANESSGKLTQSIRIATWVGGVAAVLGVALGYVSFFQERSTSNIQVGQKVFEECFDYYAAQDPKTGIDKTTVQTCKEKAKDWENSL